MIFSPRIRLKALSEFCHRLAIATSAGIEDRRIWRTESDRGGRTHQRLISAVADELDAKRSITDALRTTGEYLPPLFRQMVEVGELSGQLDKTYHRLAQHYDGVLKARRMFLGKLAWPAFQLGMALFVVGLLIWIMGMLPTSPGADRVDLLGWGLIGNQGLVLYINILLAIAIGGFIVYELARRGSTWTRALQRRMLIIPVLGGALKTLCLARIAWAMQLVFDTPMDLRKAMPLALAASGNPYYADHGEEAALCIQDGMSLQMALSRTGVFPSEMLHAIAVGEESGSLMETMRRQSEIYQDKSTTAMNVIAQLFGYGMWILVALLIISLIIRLASFYLGVLDSAAQGL